MQVWTVGHSTRSAPEFMHLLRSYGIEALADVRRFPGSRAHPQFGTQALAQALEAEGMAYEWIPKLGGRRRPSSPTTQWAWRNASFQGYADYLRTDEFAEGLDALLHMAAACGTVMMCSKLLWWRCHRALISDVLVFLGIEVTHIMSEHQSRPHAYTSPARIVRGELAYPPAR